MSVSQQTFYITTAISYPNGPPHIGQAYEALATDALAERGQLVAASETMRPPLTDLGAARGADDGAFRLAFQEHRPMIGHV